MSEIPGRWWQVDTGEDLILWTVYDHPSDYPAHFVLRGYSTRKDVTLPWCALFESLDELRQEMIEAGRVCLDREPGDDPVIVETWI
jgi:hypothetical protein